MSIKLIQQLIKALIKNIVKFKDRMIRTILNTRIERKSQLFTYN